MHLTYHCLKPALAFVQKESSSEESSEEESEKESKDDKKKAEAKKADDKKAADKDKVDTSNLFVLVVASLNIAIHFMTCVFRYKSLNSVL